MWQKNIVLKGLLVTATLIASRAHGEPRSSVLRLGDPLPALAGQTLTGKQLDVNAAAGAGQPVLILSFSRAGGRDAENWAQRLQKDFPQLTIYTAIFLESVPSLFRPMAISAIRNGMPHSMQDRTIVLYRDENIWKQRLQVNSISCAGVILLGPDGHINWTTPGPFTDGLYQELSRLIRAAQ